MINPRFPQGLGTGKGLIQFNPAENNHHRDPAPQREAPRCRASPPRPGVPPAGRCPAGERGVRGRVPSALPRAGFAARAPPAASGTRTSRPTQPSRPAGCRAGAGSPRGVRPIPPCPLYLAGRAEAPEAARRRRAAQQDPARRCLREVGPPRWAGPDGGGGRCPAGVPWANPDRAEPPEPSRSLRSRPAAAPGPPQPGRALSAGQRCQALAAFQSCVSLPALFIDFTSSITCKAANCFHGIFFLSLRTFGKSCLEGHFDFIHGVGMIL